jgi:methylthioribose-1-phosphate isomerase
MTSLEWLGGRVRYIDQTALPHQVTFVETADHLSLARAIKNLEIRGAPAIGVAAAFGVVIGFRVTSGSSLDARDAAFTHVVQLFSETRPTAVNLFYALKRMSRIYEVARHNDPAVVRQRLLDEALAIQREDADACQNIAEIGAELIGPDSTLLTHCNTGALATAGGGTALNVIVESARRGNVDKVYVDETRPLFQGARLTTWELKNHGIRSILITDSTAGFLMQRGVIDAVLVGADRIAANGDVANKIGTYTLAVLAEKHDVPFYVAAPTSTIDADIATGAEIQVEERDSREVTHINGVSVAPKDTTVYAPAFDITPSSLITAIVTETTILRPPLSESMHSLLGRKLQLNQML